MTALAINTADNTAITADSINFTADGADLTNGGATDLVVKKGLSYTLSAFVNTTPTLSTPLPILYPQQTFYVNGVAITI